MTRPADPFAQYDGAYLLGALDDGERREFEAHLSACAECAARVDRLRPVLELLGSVDAADVEIGTLARPPEPPAESLLPELVARATRQRRRRRWGLGAVGGAAAAAIIALAVALGTQPAAHPVQLAGARPMVAVRQDVPLRARAALVSEPWGTKITLECRYAGAAAYPASSTYILRVTDRSGAVHQLGSWTVRAGRDTRYASGIALPIGEIGAVQIALPNGTALLQLSR